MTEDFENRSGEVPASGNNEINEETEIEVEVEMVPEDTPVVTEVIETVPDPFIQRYEKKRKTRAVALALLAILLICTVAAAVLRLTGVWYVSPDADGCVVEDYVPSAGTGAEKALTFTKERDAVNEYNEFVVTYKVTNQSEKDIWDLFGDIVFLDKNEKELRRDYVSYRGLLAPGKSVYLTANTYGVRPEKIAYAKVAYYKISVGQSDYAVDLSTGKTDKGPSDYEYYNNADFDEADRLDFTINNRGVDEYKYYNVDVKANNSGTEAVGKVTYYIDFLDKEGDIIGSGTGYIRNEISPSKTLMSEAVWYEQTEGDGSTERIDAAVINRYEYSLSSDDEAGNNYYSVDLVNRIAYGTHYDD